MDDLEELAKLEEMVKKLAEGLSKRDSRNEVLEVLLDKLEEKYGDDNVS